ncbi:MAG TPA: hypothetical protein PLB92_05845 [Rhodoglobus sp.]|nr:hypothetical protein [Rhodoglobus sp.]
MSVSLPEKLRDLAFELSQIPHHRLRRTDPEMLRKVADQLFTPEELALLWDAVSIAADLVDEDEETAGSFDALLEKLAGMQPPAQVPSDDELRRRL